METPQCAPLSPLAPSLVLVTPDLGMRVQDKEPSKRSYRVGEALGAVTLEYTERDASGCEQHGRAEFRLARLDASGAAEGRQLSVGAPLRGLQGEAAFLLPGSLILPGHILGSSYADMDASRWSSDDVRIEDIGMAFRCSSDVCLRNAAVAAVTLAAMGGGLDEFACAVRDP